MVAGLHLATLSPPAGIGSKDVGCPSCRKIYFSRNLPHAIHHGLYRGKDDLQLLIGHWSKIEVLNHLSQGLFVHRHMILPVCGLYLAGLQSGPKG